mmetsp:Transcript_27779/g.38633  ORF Transcript_27779/g.38633 Transcript_27779/m.38633 type:complete len:215 (+) Transcript_27779:112-756(+)|eukprot:CAMPEP_0201483488 /NCGR_PEP_ID=MMETSP0151_2-20130828/7690_1 /ASSEMBLY_ACC=CAM_ASM_000257 /TAXON_ID=200890 /ORGANISM="Paramoeba atlantica, Strain 621/1 / CCAP 1560/9" /LENGTH=214 /DNA_ID=CAMNT_0047866649 /DNA_START=112 /DNA_END=756 /DNA_ORIENTATION=+
MEDQDVKKQLERMSKFILDEAKNKKLEIRQSAEEEANREKDRLIRQGENAINKEIEKKVKQVEVSKKIRASNEINQSRLRVLRAREEAVNTTCSQAHQQLFSISKDQARYKRLLKDLVYQCVEVIEEQNVSFVGREADKDLIKGVLGEAASEFQKKHGKTVNLSLDSKYLDPSSAGGVVAVSEGGAVIISNTLEQRLQLAVENLLPEIRESLFS